MSFQLNTKSLFLTYPQCPYPLQEFQNALLARFGTNLLQGVCARELHADGNPHLHAAIMLKTAFRTKSVSIFDDLVQPPKHPNIDGRFKGGAKKAFLYVMKEKDFLPLPADFDLTTFVQAKKQDSKSLAIVESIRQGSTLDDLEDQFPDYLLLHLSQVERYVNFRAMKKLRLGFAAAQAIPVLVQPVDGFSSLWNSEIASWLNLNLRKKRTHRQKQLWIQAPPGSGKTSLLMSLEATFNLSIYYWPRDEKWWDGYSDSAFDLIVLDEYRAQKMITELNPILSGDPTPLSRRNAPPLVKRDLLPVLILSNFVPEDCYHKVHASQLAPLLDRLTVVQVPEGGFIRIEKVPEELPETQPEEEGLGGLADDEIDAIDSRLIASTLDHPILDEPPLIWEFNPATQSWY